MTQKLFGVGIGFRPCHYGQILRDRPKLDFLEIVTENFLGGGRARRYARELAEHYPVAMHGVALSIAGDQPLDGEYLRRLKDLADLIDSPLVSDHLCWTGIGGLNSHDLLPVPLTEETYRHVAARVRYVQDFLGRPLGLENPSAYAAFAGAEIGEAQFLDRLCRETGAFILLDVNNLFVNSQNLGVDPIAYLETLSRESVRQFHLAGHVVEHGVRIDTHDAPVPDEVWELYRVAARLFPDVPTLVEWDDKLPTLERLIAEAETARSHHAVAQKAELAVLKASARAAILELPPGLAPLPETPPPHGTALEGMQRSLWDLIRHPAGVTPDLPAIHALDPTMPVPRERGAGVYNNAYFLRLRDVAALNVPALAKVAGDRFGDLFGSFLAEHPSRHFSVDRAADAMPAWLRSEPFDDEEFGVPAHVLGDIAELELARSAVFFADDTDDVLPTSALAEIDPEAWESVRFSFVTALRVVSCTCDAWSVVTAVESGAAPEKPKSGDRHYIVTRPEETVEVEEIDGLSARALAAMQSGLGFRAAAEHVTASDEDLETVAGDLVQRLVRWVEAGYVTAIHIPSEGVVHDH